MSPCGAHRLVPAQVRVEVTADGVGASVPAASASTAAALAKQHQLLYGLQDQPPAVMLLLLAVQVRIPFAHLDCQILQ